jgi:CRISPR-associated protein Cas2
MFVVVSYDIPDDRRRTRVMKALKDFGQHVQYSVFECDLRREDLDRMRRRLKDLIQTEEDNVRLYFLCGQCLPKMRAMGKERVEQVKGHYIV